MKRYPELIGLIARLMALGIGHVREGFAPARAAHGPIDRSVEAGLLERCVPLRGEPALVRGVMDAIALPGPETAVAVRGDEVAGRVRR